MRRLGGGPDPEPGLCLNTMTDGEGCDDCNPCHAGLHCAELDGRPEPVCIRHCGIGGEPDETLCPCNAGMGCGELPSEMTIIDESEPETNFFCNVCAHTGTGGRCYGNDEECCDFDLGVQCVPDAEGVYGGGGPGAMLHPPGRRGLYRSRPGHPSQQRLLRRYDLRHGDGPVPRLRARGPRRR